MWTHSLASPEPDQDAVGGGDDRLWDRLLAEVIGHLCDPQVRSEGRGGRLHDVLHRHGRVAAQRAGGDQAQDDTLRIDDNAHVPPAGGPEAIAHITEDRKSTRLNSSHVKISYAVFCL